MSTEQPHVQRAILLLQTQRYADAEKELRAAISEEPDTGQPYALLALCLFDGGSGSPEESFRLASRAIALEPENSFAHYALSYVCLRRKEYDAADTAIMKAIELDQYDADYYGLRGAIFLARNRREEARQAFREALAIDPNHHQSLTFLSQIESQLGNVDEAHRIAKQAVQNAPENADAHVARGYSFVYSNRPKEAFEAFREALRLDPNSDYARAGLLQALQMHHFFYRGMFRFFAWMNRLSGAMQWGLIIGFLIGYRILSNLMRQHPEWTPFLLPIVIVYLAFVFMSWLSDPLSFFLLMFNRWGRLAMNARQKISGLVVVTFIPLGILGLVRHGGSELIELTGLGLLLTVLPLTCFLRTETPRLQRIYGIYTLAMVAVLAAAIPTGNPVFVSIAVLMFVGFQFLANYFTIQAASPI